MRHTGDRSRRNRRSSTTAVVDESSIDGSSSTSGRRQRRSQRPRPTEPGEGAVQTPSRSRSSATRSASAAASTCSACSVVAAHWVLQPVRLHRAYAWTSTYTFTCNMTETVSTPALGVHDWAGDEQAGQQAKDECDRTQIAHPYDDLARPAHGVQTVTGRHRRRGSCRRVRQHRSVKRGRTR